MASAPVYNPQIPYLGIVPGGLQPGRMVKIQGTVPPSSPRFAVNLLCGPNMNAGDDIALHFNPRFTENRIIRNSLQHMNWQQEEFHGNSMPLVRGQSFEIIILCDPHHYKIAINGHHFTEFVHRLPYQRVTHLSIDGEVAVALVVVEGGLPVPGAYGAAPMPLPGAAAFPPGGHMYPNLPQPGMPGAQHYPSQPGAYGQPGYAQAPAYPAGQYGLPPGGYNSNPAYPSTANTGLGGFLDRAGASITGALATAGIRRAMGGGGPTGSSSGGSFLANNLSSLTNRMPGALNGLKNIFSSRKF